MAETNSLFRQDALQTGFSPQAGKPMFHQPVPLWVYTSFILSVVLSLVLFAGLNNFKSSFAVRGVLLPASGVISVYPPGAGIYEQAGFAEGDTVQAGDTVAFVLANVEGDTRPGSNREQVRQAHLLKRHRQLQEQLNIHVRKGLASLQQLREKEHFLRSEIDQIQAEWQVYQQRLQLSTQETTASRQLLQQNHLSAAAYRQQLDRHLSLQEHGHAVSRNLQLNRQHLADNLARQQQLPVEHRQTSLELEAELAAVAYELDELALLQKQTLLAPVTGMLSSLQVASGERAHPDIPAFNIIPQHELLEARLYLPAGAIGSVTVGQEVLLNFDAFDYQQFGLFAASITVIAESSTDPRRSPLPVPGNEAMFLVKARLQQQQAGPQPQHRFRPSMLFSAEIVLADKALLRYLLDPLLRVLEK
ncbi:MAG: HlyD family efflux transporter periplasmic adaptor subunit [Pseudomonadales bacterium]|nr:HlyD family efflux transporter periplasmic adaptor subunit [Pseudomonadales bacterium]